MIKEFYFSLSLTNEEFFPFYKGDVQSIQVMTNKGLTIRFPAMHLRTHVRSDGIQGNFLLLTENNKFKSLHKI